jgi:hypothetical protein
MPYPAFPLENSDSSFPAFLSLVSLWSIQWLINGCFHKARVRPLRSGCGNLGTSSGGVKGMREHEALLSSCYDWVFNKTHLQQPLAAPLIVRAESR